MVNKKVKIPGINKSIITGGDFVTIAQCGGLFLPGEINEVPSQDRFTHTINDFIKAIKKMTNLNKYEENSV